MEHLKPAFDILQKLLSIDGPAGIGICFLVALLFFNVIKIISKTFSAAWAGLKLYVNAFYGQTGSGRFAKIAIIIGFGFALYSNRNTMHDFLQELEPPIYEGQFAYMGDSATCAVFENRLRATLSPENAGIVIAKTHEIADSLNFPPSWLYGVAASECGLNPFIIRRDGIAAGWIQFTAVGLSGIQPKHTLAEVKAWCENKQARPLMEQTMAYLAHHLRGKQVTRAVDVYLAVFAPATVGAAHDKVLYSGYNNPSYYLNAGLDGWQRRADGRIIRLASNCDGNITVGELALCLEYKKNKMLA